ncbi:hypothetical protein [Cohnella zeiphila]|uniref:Uncharacterized protein n=1 Tax=Cohnella zeiphila TaxID=2761120 RepID=A0A7X0SKZ2_9BACL|nr:hypothetical protein [Cohnella zeiphila]MBB6731912.1 hypothetical protein [Cohnella zeiphila]
MRLNADKIQVGKRYVMVERPLYKAIVTIIADERGKSGKDWDGWKVRFEEVHGRMNPKIGTEISVGWSEKYSHYAPIEFYEIEEATNHE